MDTIDENNHHSSHYRRTSFSGLLREEGLVDIEEYLKLEEAVYDIPELNLSDKEKHNKTVRFGIISTSVLRAIVHHKSPTVKYTIKNYPVDELHTLINRMNSILDGLNIDKLPERSGLPEILEV